MEFAACPILTELISSVEDQFDVKGRALRPATYPDIPFKVQTLQIYDDVLLRWVDLYSTTQPSFINGCQVYAFQPESLWVQDYQGAIPSAERTFTWSSHLGSPRRARLIADHGIPAGQSEKIRSVFNDLATGKTYISFVDLRASFVRYNIDFTFNTIGELFNRADTNRDGHITYEEWVRFSIDFPNVIDALYFKARDLGVSIIPNYSATEIELTRIRSREAELSRIYDESNWQGERARLEQDYEAAKREAEEARSRADSSAAYERQAFDKILYQPASPRRFFR